MTTRRTIQVSVLAMAVLISVIGWTLHQAQAAPAHSLDQLFPEGALLYIEAKDFSSLLNDWTASPEKAQWLKSDDYRVFSNSRLFLRLKKASDEFASAAGVPPSMQFLNDAAGKETALAIYNIGNLEVLYVTRLSSGNFLQSALWQSRNKFEPRDSGGKPFFVRKDQESGRVVAFGVADNYLVLGTREDLVAAALQLLSGGKTRSLKVDGWYQQALAATQNPAGDLRMMLNLEKIAVTPHFRTYWIQQNITEMQSYAVAVSDLYRDGAVYREERVIVPKKTTDDEAGLQDVQQSVSALLALVPKEHGFYRAAPVTGKESLATVEQKILAPHFGAAPAQKLAPEVQLTGGRTGSASDLETRIDQAPASNLNEGSTQALRQQFTAANPEAMLVVHSTRKNEDGVLLNIASLVAIAGSSDWDLPGVESGIQQVVAPGLTAGQLGTQWREVKDAGGYSALDGLSPIFLAHRGKVLFFASDETLLKSALQTTTSASSGNPVAYAAGFNHSQERKNFYELTRLTDKGTASGQQPQFFSQNISSLSRTFGRVEREEIVVRRSKDKIQQTVTYHWAK